MGKGLGNGYPISAVALSPVIMSGLQDISFRYSQSHQNDPLGCAVAREVITCMKRDDTVELSREMGDYLKSRLSQLKEKHQIVEEVRGRGLMTAVEFRKNIGNEVIAAIRSQLLQRGYILAMRPRLNVFRIDPPLIISKGDIDGFLKCFDQILSEIDAGCMKETPDSALRQV